MRIELPYGRTPYSVELADRPVRVLEAARMPDAPELGPLLEAALDAPLGGPPLRAVRSATLIVSDGTRDEPRGALAAAIARRLPGVHWTIAIATGTHGPARIEELGLPGDLLRGATIINHDGHSAAELVTLGETARGTPIVVHRCVVETELVVATGCIRPHYFAGFGAGAKAIFPGLGGAAAIRTNHRWKTASGARAGVLDGNPCREDLEEAVARVPAPIFLLDGVCGPGGGIHAAVAGDVFRAFRAGAQLARPWFTVRAPRAPLVIASDGPPITTSLYQAAKIAAAAAPLVAAGGTLVVVAECSDGIGPLDVVNEAIFRIGVLPRLAPGVKLRLVSGLRRADVEQTLLEAAASVADVASSIRGEAIVIPRASHLICESHS